MIDPRRGIAAPVTLNLRPSIATYALALEAKAQERDDRPWWGEIPIAELHHLAYHELVKELGEAIGTGEERHSIKGEAVDTGLYAMMIFDNAARGADDGKVL